MRLFWIAVLGLGVWALVSRSTWGDPVIRPSSSFTWDEFACHDGTAVPEIYRANIRNLCLYRLEPLRDYFNSPVHIVSGFRTVSWNHRIGGAVHSQHLVGKAADIRVMGVEAHEVANWFEQYYPISGIGRYVTFTHIDIRGLSARWSG